MFDRAQRRISLFPILSLPQLAFAAVLQSLPAKDRQSLASTCRSLAAAVNAASQSTILTVRSSTGWEGLCKVITSRTLSCKDLILQGEDICRHPPSASSALDVLLRGSSTTPGCLLRGTKRVTIRAFPLPCMLPPSLACILPDAEHLIVDYDGESGQYADLQPLPYCSSVQKISYCTYFTALHLPDLYHTPEDLRRQLPNVSNLELRTYVREEAKCNVSLSCMDTMMQAWGSQLTELDIWVMKRPTPSNSAELTYTEWMPLQHCTRLQKLSWNVDRMHPPFQHLSAVLTDLHLGHDVQEEVLKSILQFTHLRVVDMKGFRNRLQHDWSQHPCTWQQLKLEHCLFTDLSKLPLHSLKGNGCLEVLELQLPDPRHPNSLSDVMLAAQHISDAGLVVKIPRYAELLESGGWLCDLWKDLYADLTHDEALAEILQVASGVVKPPTTYQFQKHHVSHYPKTAEALIRWLSSSIHSVTFLDSSASLQQWFWQALQGCACLSKVCTFNPSEELGAQEFVEQVSRFTQMAASYLVAVRRRPLEVHARRCHVINKEEWQKASKGFPAELQKRLPSSVAVSKYTCERPIVVVLEPCT